MTPYILFSYWILVWYIFYKINLIPFNPFYIAVVAVVYILIILFVMLMRSDNTLENYKNILLFIIINIFLKFLPTIDMYHNPSHTYDIVFGLVLFAIYNIYLYSKGRTFASIYFNIDSIEAIRNGELFIMRTIKKKLGI